MSKRNIFQAITVAIAILIAADLWISRATQDVLPRQTIRRIESAPSAIDVLGIGNSLIAAGFDSVAVEQTFLKSGRPCVAVNGGLGGSGVIEHLALARLALRRHSVKFLLYGFFDRSMTVDAVKNSDLIGNRNMLYYQEPQLALRYAHFDAIDRLSFELCRSTALLRERGSVWAKVENLRRRMSALGTAPQQTNRFGRTADFALLEASDSNSFMLSCQKLIQSGNFLSAPVQALLQQARQHGVKVIVIEMPVHPSHLASFYALPIWDEFRNATRLAVERSGATYLNASAWIPGEGLFADRLHLSEEGAGEFSRMAAAYLMRLPN